MSENGIKKGVVTGECSRCGIAGLFALPHELTADGKDLLCVECQAKPSESLKQKLHPKRFISMSGKMGAILGCIMGEAYTNPRIAELVVTSDGMVLGRAEGDCGMNEFIGAESDLDRNWESLLDAAKLTLDERVEAQMLYRAAVRRA